MNISEKKIPALFKIKPPKKGAFTIETPEHVPKLHTLMIASGKRGGGKSVAVANYVKQLMDKKLIDRCILITPTFQSNAEIWEPLHLNNEDIHEPHKWVLKDIIKKIEGERKDWDDHQEIVKKYKSFKSIINDGIELSEVPNEAVAEFDRLGFFEGEPFWKYSKVEPPKLFVVIDDCVGMPLLSCPSAGLTQFCVKHRHYGMGLGCSVAMLVQTYCGIGAIARPIRENVTLLCLFKCIQDVQLKKIFSEVIGDEMTEEEFLALFVHATTEPYSFLTLDFACDDKAHMFRKRFDNYLEFNSTGQDLPGKGKEKGKEKTFPKGKEKELIKKNAKII